MGKKNVHVLLKARTNTFKGAFVCAAGGSVSTVNFRRARESEQLLKIRYSENVRPMWNRQCSHSQREKKVSRKLRKGTDVFVSVYKEDTVAF